MGLLIMLSSLALHTAMPQIDVWVDQEDATYHPTENLHIFFRVDHDCYVAVYNIDVEGRETCLFPREDQNAWVQAGQTYELPGEDADIDYVVTGPAGTETIVIVTSYDNVPAIDEQGLDIGRTTYEVYIEESEPAVFRVISTPPGCRIYMKELATGDEEYIGTAPYTVAVRPGEYEVTLKKFGYRTMTRRVWLDPGEQRRVFVKLIPY
jgi:hypothetical protein